jgi:ABC-type cobalamin/Fe3+-siderophores transport system ATPase subunit
MIPIKRMRVFAGPNGSGKTTIFKGILKENIVDLGVYVNADELELQLNQYQSIDFSDYQINVSENQLKDFFRKSKFSPVKRNKPDLYNKVTAIDNCFIPSKVIDSYLTADLAEFIRQQTFTNWKIFYF